MSKAYTPQPNQNQTPLSLAIAEQQLNDYRRQGLKTKARKSEYDRLKNHLSRLYNDNKKFLIEFERTNYAYLSMLRSTHGFFKIIGHSALFYAYNIAPRLNLKANLQPDGDFAHKSAEGIVSIRHPEKVAEALQTINIKQLQTKDRTGNFLLFKLPWTFTEDQVTELIERQNQKLQNLNRVVIADNIIPVLFLQLEELLKSVYENIRGMGGPVERETFGYDLLKTIIKMNHAYFALTSGQLSKHTCLTQLKSHLGFVKFQVKLLADLKIWTPKVSARIAETVITIQEIVLRELKNSNKE